jgi:ATP-dependent DNA helicase PIF1
LSGLQVEAVATLINGVGESMLYSCLERERKNNPDPTEQDHLKAAARQLVPPTVPGSPAYHRSKLQDLLAIVNKNGIPSLFLTLTADELTHMRWPEVQALERQGPSNHQLYPTHMARHAL